MLGIEDETDYVMVDAEQRCESCLIFTHECFLERAPNGALVCPACVPDDDDDEPECECDGFCRRCVGV